MEQFSEKEAQLLRELQAKQKRIQRQEKQFLAEADARKEELLTRWGINDDLDFIARMYYDTGKETLREYIKSDQQVSYFKRTHRNTGDI